MNLNKFDDLKVSLRETLEKIVNKAVFEAFEKDLVTAIDRAAAKTEMPEDDEGEVIAAVAYDAIPLTEDEAYEEIREKAEDWAVEVGETFTEELRRVLDDLILEKKHYVPNNQ
jgi:hypothetical protein